MTGDDPYTGVNGEKITNYQAGALEQRMLHMQTADTLRTPTYTLFPKPDYFFGTTGAERRHQPLLRLQPRLLQPEHRHHLGRRSSAPVWPRAVSTGPPPAGGNESTTRTRRTPCRCQPAGHLGRGDRSAPDAAAPRRATDDYQTDGRVISQALRSPSSALRDTEDLAAAYQQINSSVGAFATDTLIADSAALAGGSSGDDSAYQHEQQQLLATGQRTRRPRRRDQGATLAGRGWASAVAHGGGRRGTARPRSAGPGTPPGNGRLGA